jgi:hypothetical protein
MLRALLKLARAILMVSVILGGILVSQLLIGAGRIDIERLSTILREGWVFWLGIWLFFTAFARIFFLAAPDRDRRS